MGIVGREGQECLEGAQMRRGKTEGKWLWRAEVSEERWVKRGINKEIVWKGG